MILKMQLTFSCSPATYGAVENTLTKARLARYLDAAKGDKHHALRLYVWNARLCEAFYLPSQICEVALRNAIHGALRDKHGPDWYQRGAFLCTLPDRLRQELDKVVRDQRTVHNGKITLDHIVADLSLGFWQHLLVRAYDGVFWPKYFHLQFPHKPRHIGRQQVYDSVEDFRGHRNRIAHHKPIFHRQPSAELQNLLRLIGWICPETHWLCQTLSQVQQTINERPRA